MTMKRTLAAILCLLLATPAWADFNKAAQAYNNGDYATAFRAFRPLALQGNPVAQFSLGVMYANGQGIPRDYVQAYKWFEIAAYRGHKLGIARRTVTAKKMNPAQIAEAKKLVREWWAKHGKTK